MGIRIRQPVLAVLLAAGLLAAVGLAFLTHAPNRLITGTGISLASVVGTGAKACVLLPALLLFLAAFRPAGTGTALLTLAGAGGTLAGLTWLAGAHASALVSDEAPLGRTSLGGGYWALAVLCWLATAEALRQWPDHPWRRRLAGAGVLAPVVALAVSGQLDTLSLFKEYANRQDVFDAALLRHLQIVLLTVIPTILIGVPLGVLAARNARWRGALLPVLNLIQTVPSIALFALLMVPLAALASHWPVLTRWGISGIGLAPAVVALTLYSLLPMVRSTMAGLQQVPPEVVEAARGMGMDARRLFWQVELPLALPVWLAGLRVSTVQAIGLAVVAALIGAGGFGALMFQGLLSSALDLVLLGVLPVITLAMLADALLKGLASQLTRKDHSS